MQRKTADQLIVPNLEHVQIQYNVQNGTTKCCLALEGLLACKAFGFLDLVVGW